MKLRAPLVALALVAGGCNSSPTAPGLTHRSITVANSTFRVNGGGFATFSFTVPSGARSAVLTGTFSSSGGIDDRIRVLVMTAADFERFRRGTSVPTRYSSGFTTAGTLRAELFPENWLLVFDGSGNVFDRSVAAQARLDFDQ